MRKMTNVQGTQTQLLEGQHSVQSLGILHKTDGKYPFIQNKILHEGRLKVLPVRMLETTS